MLQRLKKKQLLDTSIAVSRFVRPFLLRLLPDSVYVVEVSGLCLCP